MLDSGIETRAGIALINKKGVEKNIFYPYFINNKD